MLYPSSLLLLGLSSGCTMAALFCVWVLAALMLLVLLAPPVPLRRLGEGFEERRFWNVTSILPLIMLLRLVPQSSKMTVSVTVIAW